MEKLKIMIIDDIQTNEHDTMTSKERNNAIKLVNAINLILGNKEYLKFILDYNSNYYPEKDIKIMRELLDIK